MDSLTQIVLGAAVGEVVCGKKTGNRALILGAIGGTIPDLDVFLTAYLDPVQALYAHRGFSHSIFFPFIIAPILGWILSKIYHRLEMNRLDWTKLMFWTIFTHPLLDIFTNYGTGLFYPIWHERIAFNTIFVVDPLYTLPLLIAFIFTFFLRKDNLKRRYIAIIALLLSNLYLSITVVNKIVVDRKVTHYINENGNQSLGFMTIPAPLTNLLWSVIIKEQNGYKVGYIGLFEDADTITLNFIPKNDHLLAALSKDKKVNQLKEFSKDYYTVKKSARGFLFNDLRFSTIRGWFDLEANYIFSFQISEEANKTKIKRIAPNEKMRKEDILKLWDRIIND